MFVCLNIKKLRKERNMSLRQLAKVSGISSFSYIGNIERGVVSDPGINTIIKIAKGLDVNINELIE